MITLDNVSKQYGRQILFVEASFQLDPGDKVGLVGPNGAGKTTLFRMIVGEESADEGSVSVPKRLTIGYFRQDIGEMSGRSVLDEAIAGCGRIGELHHELEDLQLALADPDRADEMDQLLERFGTVQDAYQQGRAFEGTSYSHVCVVASVMPRNSSPRSASKSALSVRSMWQDSLASVAFT
jgi:ATPase subunit of ABC transporter with duplicated ATPase domains